MRVRLRGENENSKQHHEALHTGIQTQDHAGAEERNTGRGQHGQVLLVWRQVAGRGERKPRRLGTCTNPIQYFPRPMHLIPIPLLWLSNSAGPKHGQAEDKQGDGHAK